MSNDQGQPQWVVQTHDQLNAELKRSLRALVITATVVLGLGVLGVMANVSAGPGDPTFSFAVAAGDVLGVLGVLAAVLIALVIELDRMEGAAETASSRNAEPREAAAKAARVFIAHRTSVAAGHLAIACAIAGLFSDAPEYVSFRSVLVFGAAMAVFILAVMVNLAAVSARDIIDRLEERFHRVDVERVDTALAAMSERDGQVRGWRSALRPLWPNSKSRMLQAIRWGANELACKRRWFAFVLTMSPVLILATLGSFVVGWKVGLATLAMGLIIFAIGLASVLEVGNAILARSRFVAWFELTLRSLMLIAVSTIFSLGVAIAGLENSHAGVALVGVAMAIGLAFYATLQMLFLMLDASGAFGGGWLLRRARRQLEKRQESLQQTGGGDRSDSAKTTSLL